MIKKIFFFPGTFNPPHVGHQEIVKTLCGLGGDSRILISPSKNPQKRGFSTSTLIVKELVTEFVRVVRDTLHCDNVYSDFTEIDSDPILNYTYDSLKNVSYRYPYVKICLVIGGDQYVNFSTWSHYKDILNEFSLYVFSRESEGVKPLYHDMQTRFFLMSVPISSSFVRMLISQNQNYDAVRSFVSYPLIDIFSKYKLYLAEK